MKKLLLFFVAMLLGLFSLKAVDVQIGSGENTSQFFPIHSCYTYNYSQQIYLQNEINDAGGGSGDITKIRFYYDFGGSLFNTWKNWTIYLGNTTKASFTNTSNWVPIDQLTQVFSGDIPTPVAGTWLEITLQTPFNYTGNNIVVAVNETSPDYSCTAFWRSFTVSSNRNLIYFGDNNIVDPANPPEAIYDPGTIMSQIQFDMAAFIPTTPPNCAQLISPLNNQTVLLTQTLNWISGGGAPTSYDIYFGTSNPPEFIQNQSETTYTPSLVAGQTYYWQIVPRNSIGPSEGCPVRSFKTATETQLFESFESMTIPPLGWTNPGVFSRSTNYKYHGAASANKYTSATQALLTTPLLTITPESKLEFYALTLATTNTQRIQIKYSTDRENWLNISPPLPIPTTSKFEYFSVDLGSLAGEESEYYFAFAVYSMSSGAQVYIDHVFGPEIAPVMPGPPELTSPANNAVNVSNKPELSWNPSASGGIPNGYKIYIGTSPEPTFEWADVTASPYMVLPPLEYSTTYYWRVGAYNNAGEELSETRSFTVMDDPTIYSFPWVENFGFTASDPFPPMNWTMHSGVLANPTVLGKHPSGHWVKDDWLNNTAIPNKAAKIYMALANNGWLITPPVMIPEEGYELSFDLALMAFNSANPPQQSGTDDIFTVLIGDGTSWTPANIVRQWDNQGSEFVYNQIPNTGMKVTIPLNEPGLIQIAFYGISTIYNAANDLMIDNVTIMKSTDCLPPTNLLVSNISSSSADISWMAGSDETLWNIKYGALGFNPYKDGNLIQGVSNNTFTITGLQIITKYHIYVQANCGDGDISLWAGPILFETLCAPFTLPFIENFDETAVGYIPGCWSKAELGQGAWGVYNSNFAGGTSPEMKLNYSPSFTGISRLITPVLLTKGASNFTISLKQYLDYYWFYEGAYIAIEFSVDDGQNWSVIWQLFIDANYNAQYNEFDFELPENTEDFLIAFTYFGNNHNNINGWYFDDISIVAKEEPGPEPNLSVTGEVDGCYDATEIVTISNAQVGSGSIGEFRAGISINATDFTLLENATAYLYAGTNIVLGDGVHVSEGANFYAGIMEEITYCEQAAAMVAAKSEEIIPAVIINPETTESVFTLFPNPSTGRFTLLMKETDETSTINIEIFDMMGEKILQTQLFGQNQHEFDLTSSPKGIYILRILNGKQASIEKLIKH